MEPVLKKRTHFSCNKLSFYLLINIFALSLPSAHAKNVFWDHMKSGKVDLNIRFRYENVDDDTQQREANAHTARIALGYKTGSFHGFGFYGQLEHVQEFFGDDFSYPGRIQPGFPVVADPEGTEINQAYLSYAGKDNFLSNTSIKIGRQQITYREAPFHRFIGTILWRQNWQTFDAVSIVNQSLADITFSYAYVWNINRIFGEDAPDPFDDFESNSHIVNIKYEGLKAAEIEAYAYLLDFDNAAQFSTNTYGLRANGDLPLNNNTKMIYAAEYAHQSDTADNTNQISAGYFLGELGVNFQLDSFVKSLTLKFSYELLDGNGGADRFVTILGTNHAFQGWADRFLITPGDGIEDIYFTAAMKMFGTKFIASYHALSSDRDNYDYGTELDLLVTKTFKKHYTVGLKYSDYNTDQNNFNSANTAADVSKFWAYLQFKF